MKKLDTSAVTNSSWMPLMANNPAGTSGIDFLQQAYSECLTALAGFLVADPTKVTIMYGCNISYAVSLIDGDTEETIQPGWVFYMGELYYYPGGTYTFPPTNSYLNANIYLAHSSADPTYFSDGSLNTVHMQREITLTANGTANAGNVPDYGNWCTISTNSSATPAATAVLNNWLTSTYDAFAANYANWMASLSTVPVQVGTKGAPIFLNGWANGHGVSGVGTPSPLTFCLLQGRVYMWGEITRTGNTSVSTIFNLPPGYYPAAAEELFTVPDTTLVSSTGSTYTSPSSPPAYGIWITSGGAVTFLGSATGTFSLSLSGINFKAAPFELEQVMQLDAEAMS